MRKFIVLFLSSLSYASILCAILTLYDARYLIAHGYTDFVSFYTGASILKNDQSSRLYDLTLQNSFQSGFNVPIRKGPLPFNHPPFELIWYYPLAFVPYLTAYLLWASINLVLLFLFFKILGINEQKDISPMYLFMIFGFCPAAIAILQGQDSIVLCLLMAGAFMLLKSGKEIPAGILIALALIKFQFAIFAIIAIVARRHATAIKSFIASICVLFLCSYLMTGKSGIVQYVNLLVRMDTQNYAISPDKMANMRGLVHVLFHSWNAPAVMPLIIALTIMLYLATFILWCRTPRDQNIEMLISQTFIMAVLGSYHCNIHDLAILLVPICFIAKYLLSSLSKWSFSKTILFIALAAFMLPFPFYITLLSSGYFPWVCVLLIIVLFMIERTKRQC